MDLASGGSFFKDERFRYHIYIYRERGGGGGCRESLLYVMTRF